MSNTLESAFPAIVTTFDDRRNALTAIGCEGGLSLRDAFAIAALSNPYTNIDGCAPATQIAAHAYQIADAMLAERSKP